MKSFEGLQNITERWKCYTRTSHLWYMPLDAYWIYLMYVYHTYLWPIRKNHLQRMLDFVFPPLDHSNQKVCVLLHQWNHVFLMLELVLLKFWYILSVISGIAKLWLINFCFDYSIGRSKIFVIVYLGKFHSVYTSKGISVC